jgi:hypothetical protein
VSSSMEIEVLEADARYYRDRLSLRRAKVYRWGLGRDARLLELERNLERTERRLKAQRSRTKR